jgi:phytoene/squalene synthetase
MRSGMRVQAVKQVTATSAQRALGFVAARHRGDLAGAEELIGSFDTEQQRLLAFSLVLELSLALLAQSNDETFEQTTQRLGLSLAGMDEDQAT